MFECRKLKFFKFKLNINPAEKLAQKSEVILIYTHIHIHVCIFVLGVSLKSMILNTAHRVYSAIFKKTAKELYFSSILLSDSIAVYFKMYYDSKEH